MRFWWSDYLNHEAGFGVHLQVLWLSAGNSSLGFDVCIITDDYYTPILTWRKSISVRKDEQAALSVVLGELRWVRWGGGRKGWGSWWAMVNRPLDHWVRGPISTPQLQLLSPTRIRRWFKGCSESQFWIPLTQSHVTGSSASQFSEHYQQRSLITMVVPRWKRVWILLNFLAIRLQEIFPFGYARPVSSPAKVSGIRVSWFGVETR